MYTQPRTWIAGELVTAALLNTHLRDNLKAIGEWAPGDLKMTYVTHANATSSTLTEPQLGWYIANGATFVQANHPNLYAALGTTTLPDFRGRQFVAPGIQDGHTFTRGDVGGEYDHVQSQAELAAHSHGASGSADSQGSHGGHASGVTNDGGVRFVTGGGGMAWHDGTLSAADGSHSHNIGVSVSSAGSSQAMPVMDPFLVGGMVLIKNDN